MHIQSKFLTVSDNANLHYLEAGQGKTLLMLPGAGLSADIFKYQMQIFSRYYRVISIDKRGHGKSEKVEYGYRISRFAKDLDDFFNLLNIEEAYLLCHSLGASMIYEYIDLFGIQKIKKVVVIDEPPVLLVNPIWSANERKNYGCIYEANSLHQMTNSFMNENPNNFNKKIVDSMTTKYATEDQKQFILECMRIPGAAAAKLYFNNICQDFRDVLTKISVPTLFITGRASLHPWESHQWMSSQIKHSTLEIFEEEEGGNHFMFVENPEKFNRVILNFYSME